MTRVLSTGAALIMMEQTSNAEPSLQTASSQEFAIDPPVSPLSKRCRMQERQECEGQMAV